MGELGNYLFGFLNEMGHWLLDGLVYILRAFFYLIIDGLLTVITTFFNAFDLGNHLVSLSSALNMLPPQFLWLFNALGIPQGISILTWAIGIRLAINLIPAEFTRL